MDSFQCIQVAMMTDPYCDSPFALRLKGDGDIGFSDFSCNDDTNKDLAAQQLFQELEQIRLANAKRFNRNNHQQVSTLPAQILVESPNKARTDDNPKMINPCGSQNGINRMGHIKESKGHLTDINGLDLASKTGKINETVIAETRFRKGVTSQKPQEPEVDTTKKISFREEPAKLPESLVVNPSHLEEEENLDCRPQLGCERNSGLSSHLQHPPDTNLSNLFFGYGHYNQSACNAPDYPNKTSSSNWIGISQPDYSCKPFYCAASEFLPYVGFGFNVPKPLYGDTWGEPPDDYENMEPEILSVIEEVDDEEEETFDDKHENFAYGGDKPPENTRDDFIVSDDDSSNGNCMGLLGFSKLKQLSLSSGPDILQGNFKECPAFTVQHTNHKCKSSKQEFASNAETISTFAKSCSSDDSEAPTVETECLTEISETDDPEDQVCSFFFNGCISSLSSHFTKRKQSCVITPIEPDACIS